MRLRLGNTAGRASTAALTIALLLAGCGPSRVAPAAPVAPKFPEYVFPTAPADVAAPAVVAHQQNGWQFLQTGDTHAAEKEFSAALKQSPDFYPAEAALGYSALARKDASAAIGHFDKALSHNNAYAPALAGKGDALLSQNHLDLALRAFEDALTADPSLQALRARVDVLKFRTTQQDITAARKAADEGRLDDARTAYQEAIAASPQSPFLYRELAAVERQDNDLDAALEHAQKAASLDPTDPRALILTGEILEARGALDAAIESFSAALALEPNDALATRLEGLRSKAALAAMPPEYQAIPTAQTVTREQLAALIGVRLQPLLSRLDRRTAVVITDARTSWASPWILSVARAGVMEVYANHTFQPGAIVRRADLARAASRVLALVADEKPALGAEWRNAKPRRFPDVGPGHLSYPAVSLVVEAGVMGPAEDGSFQLARPATGPETVAAISKLEALAQPRSR